MPLSKKPLHDPNVCRLCELIQAAKRAAGRGGVLYLASVHTAKCWHVRLQSIRCNGDGTTTFSIHSGSFERTSRATVTGFGKARQSDDLPLVLHWSGTVETRWPSLKSLTQDKGAGSCITDLFLIETDPLINNYTFDLARSMFPKNNDLNFDPQVTFTGRAPKSLITNP